MRRIDKKKKGSLWLYGPIDYLLTIHPCCGCFFNEKFSNLYEKSTRFDKIDGQTGFFNE
jgi:hypothetical protein